MKTVLVLLVTLITCPAVLAVTQPDTLQPLEVVSVVPAEINVDDTVVKLAVTDTIPKQAMPVENRAKDLKEKKILAGFLSFPFPLGFLGAHRIMMGTKPWVPIAYVATFGGCFGLLPLIDFCVIMCSDNIEQYENNPNIFMWIK